MAELSGKVILITGASSGIGKATAIKFASMGAKVLIVAHKPEKAHDALNDVKKKSGSDTVELFLAELDNLLEALIISDGYHLLGQSWGGMLGAEHAIRRPGGLKGLILSNSPASMDLWASEAKILRAELPRDVEDALDRHEAAGTVNDPEYLAASQAYYDEHVCRVLPNPPGLLRTMEFMAKDSTVYNTMNGPNEFFCIGSLRSWSVVDRVSLITAPTLLLSGRFDEATPATVQPFFDNIEDVRWEIFERSSHMPFVEEPELFRGVVEAFLAEHD